MRAATPVRAPAGARPVVGAVGAGAWLVRAFSRLVVNVFYRRVEVVGVDRLPAGGPVIVAANHQNAMVDPMLLLTVAGRPLVPLAKAPLFRHPLISPFLKLAGAIPVHRRGDPGADPDSNIGMFRHAVAALAAGRALLIFPEGTSQAQPVLQPLRTGVARMLLAAEAAHGGALGVRLVPAGLVYHEPGRFRAGQALVAFGEPVDTADCVALSATDPPAAARRLTERLTEQLRALIVEADDRETLRLLGVLEAVAREESAPAGDEAGRIAWMRQAMRAYRWLLVHAPVRVASFRQHVERYAKTLELAGLAPDGPLPAAATTAAWRHAAREGAALLLGSPLAAIGMALHGIPYWLTRLSLRALPHDPDEEATYGIASATVLYPLCWAAEAWLVWRLGGGRALAAILAVLLPSGFFALGWRDRLQGLCTDALVLLRLVRDPRLGPRLGTQRRALLDEMRALVESVPGDLLA